ncbi:MAG: redoxin domain-containing protein [Candidatus Nitrosocosmicus sp.]|nr:redoxin domain-containing protein [Candidatus Nitrosocosmicus sp.]
MIKKSNFIIIILIVTIISVLGYVTTTTSSSISTYAISEISNKSGLNANVDQGENIQKTVTVDKPINKNTIDSDKTVQFKKAPEFQKIEGSINTNDSVPISIASLKGKVVLVEFWTYSCINTLRTLPHLLDWDAKYSDDGLAIVGVHTPEFEFEKNTDNVEYAVQKYGIKYPILQDNARGTWNAYENNYWPRMYLVDAQGNIRYDKIGEGDYDNTENMIKSLLNERNTSNKHLENMGLDNNSKGQNNSKNSRVINFLAQPVDFSKIKTPELYFGNQSSRSALGNPEGVKPGQTINYSLPSYVSSPTPSSTSSSLMPKSGIKPSTIYLEGLWKSNPDNLELQSNTGRILLNYSAKAVNMVVGVNSSGDKDQNQNQNNSQVTVYEDGSLISDTYKGIDVQDNGSFITEKPRLYNIVNHPSYDDEDNDGSYHSLLIDIKGKGFQTYVFTFG